MKPTPRIRHRFGWLLAILAAFALVTAACGSDSDGTDTASDDSTTDDGTDSDDTDSDGSEAMDESGEVFRVAIVAPSTVNDLSWTQALGDGLKALEDSQNLELSFSESLFVVEDAGAAIRDYASQGYDLVIAHGTQYAGSIEEIAPEYPEVSFAYGTSTDTLGQPNVYAYTADAEEGGYANGVMAAAMTDQPIGIVGPVEAGDAKLYVDGFIEGAAAGGGEATVNYTGSFSDVALASAAAEAFAANGAEVLTGTSQSVVGAVGVSADNDIPWFATQANQTQLAPELVVASHVYHFEVIFDTIIDQVKAGTYGGESLGLTYENGGFVLEFNDGYALDPEIKALGEDTVAAIVAGEIDPAGATE